MLKVAELFADLLLNTSSYNKSLNVAVASARTAANNISKIMSTSLNGVTARANKMGAALTEALRNRPLAATKSLAAAISKVSTSLETAVGPRALSNLQLVTASLSSATRAMRELSTQAARARNSLASVRVPAVRQPRTTGTQTATVTPAVAAGQALSQVLENQIPRAARRASSSVQEANSSMQKSFKDTARIIQGILISQGFYALIRSIKEAAAAVVSFSQDMEQAAISYSILLGSQDKADRFLRALKDFAAVTPFTAQEASNAAQRLLAMGFAAESIIPTMRTLTDASAIFGGSSEQLDRIVLALGQMKTNGKIAGQEIRQLAEAGIPAYKILKEELGLTTEQLAKIGDLKISGDLGVEALLRGMQKRYAGASERISKTLRGLMSTIKDDLLIISEAIFAGPYERVRQFAQGVVTALEKMRATFDRTGLGGLFESLVPPRLQQNVRTIIASLQSLGESFMILWRAIQPVVQVLGEYLVKALSLVLPVIAGIIRGIASFVKSLTSSVPAIRLLIGTIAGLLIASTAAAAIAKLAVATKLLGIAQAVGRAVLFLAKAIQVLYVACAKNPITAIILIVSTALLGLALSSETASKWLDAVIQRLGKLAGLKTEGLLNPTSTKEISDQMNEFNKSLIDSQKDLKGVGKAAADTQKKTDKFLASFDEVYQVPENLDDVAEGMEDIGAQLPDLEDIKVPEIDMDTAIPDVGESIADQLKNIPPLVLPKFEWPEPPQPPSIPPGAAAVVTDGFFAELQARLNNIKVATEGILTQMLVGWQNIMNTLVQPAFAPVLVAVEAVKTSFATVPAAVQNVVAQLQAAFAPVPAMAESWKLAVQNAVSGILTSIQTLPELVFTAIQLMTSQAIAAVANFGAQLLTGFQIAVANAMVPIRNFATEVYTTVSTALANAWVAISTWVVDTAKAFANWATENKGIIIGTMLAIGAIIALVLTGGLAAIGAFVASAIAAIGAWATGMVAGAGAMAAGTAGAISVGMAAALGAITAFVAAAALAIIKWKDEIGTAISEWATSAYTAVAEFATNAGLSIVTFVTDSALAIKNWVTNTAKDIAGWVVNTVNELKKWGTNAATEIGTFLTKMYRSIVDKFKEAGDVIIKFFKEDIPNWIKEHQTSILVTLGLLLAAVVAAIVASVVSVPAAIAAGLAAIVLAITTAFKVDMVNGIKEAFGMIPDKLLAIKDSLVSTAQRVASAVTEPFTSAISGIKTALSNIGSGISTTVANIGASVGLKGYATGGIVDREQIVKVGEGDKREAIIPLESTAMRPFAQAVAQELGAYGSSNRGSNTPDTRPILYVGTLIADDKSLKELERKMEVIRIQENQRKGA